MANITELKKKPSQPVKRDKRAISADLDKAMLFLTRAADIARLRIELKKNYEKH